MTRTLPQEEAEMRSPADAALITSIHKILLMSCVVGFTFNRNDYKATIFK